MAEHSDSSTSDRENQDDGILGERYSAGADLRTSGRESPLKAVLHVTIVLVLCSIAAAMYWSRVQDTKKISELIKQARDLQKADDFASLQKARTKFAEALAIREDNRAVAGLAMVAASLWGLHGLEDMKAEAEKYSARANELDIPNGDRCAAEGYLKVFGGQPEKGEQYLRSILDQLPDVVLPARVAELAHRCAELCAVRHHREAPDQAQHRQHAGRSE